MPGGHLGHCFMMTVFCAIADVANARAITASAYFIGMLRIEIERRTQLAETRLQSRDRFLAHAKQLHDAGHRISEVYVTEHPSQKLRRHLAIIAECRTDVCSWASRGCRTGRMDC